jgi:hypothetical protein
MNMHLLRALAFAALVLLGHLHAQVPGLLNYQGRVASGGVNFDGAGKFRFALVNTDGSVTYWSNDGTSVAGGAPTDPVTLVVSKGLYSVLLGDPAIDHMTAIPASVFAHADVRLRVWFDDGTNLSQLLAPDQRLAAVGYAMIAADVPDGAITAGKIAPGAVGATQLAAGSVGTAQLAGNGVTAANIASGQVVKNLNGLVDGVTLAAGANISLTPAGNTLTIASDNPPLATWPGSTNLITVGNVTTGSWRATPIDDAYLASAAAWNAKQPGNATLTTLSGKGMSGTGDVALALSPIFTSPSVAGTVDNFTIGNGGWYVTAVPYLRPIANTGIAFDVMPRGAAGGDCWIDICSTDVVADAANFEDLDLKKTRNGPGFIGCNAVGTGVVRDVMIQTQGGSVGIGTPFSATNGFLPVSLLHLASGGSTDLSLSSTGGGFAGLRAYHAGGTLAAPSASQSGNNLLFIGAKGFGLNQYNGTSDCGIFLQASENFTNAAHGTLISFQTTTPGTATRMERLKVDVDITVGTGNLIVASAGKGLQLKSGANARAGNATLVGGAVTVPNTSVSANTLVMLTRKSAGGTMGFLTYSVAAGTGFTITSESSADTSVVSYQLIELN